jgi:hypothetical protein
VTAPSTDVTPRVGIEAVRRRNWIAVAVATPLMMFSTFAYAAAFTVDDAAGARWSFDLRLAFVGLAVAPFVFVALGFLSRNPHAPKRVLQAMGLLLLVGLPVGLLDPLVGAATGFALGGAMVLNRPAVERVVYWRLAAVGFTFVYVFVLIVVIPPAGVFTGAVLPLIMIGFADEYAAWSAERSS